MTWSTIEGQFLVDLVAARSESYEEDACCELMVSLLPSLGWDSAGRDEMGNVVASRGNGEKELLLLGHIDTVPGGPELRVDGDILWGRGSVDAKGPLSVFALAGGRADIPDGWRYTLIAAVGEERDSRGARHVLASREAPSACIIGEPSGGDGVTLAYRGCLFMELSASDGGAHRSGDAGPLTGVLKAAAEIVSDVEAMDDDSLPVIKRYSCAVASMMGIEAGERSAEISLDVRLPLGVEPGDLIFRFEEICHKYGVKCSKVQAVSAHQSPRKDPVVRALSSAIRESGGVPRLLAKGGTADFNVVAPWKVPMAAYGPGDSTLDHCSDERISYRNFSESLDILTKALPKVCVLIDR